MATTNGTPRFVEVLRGLTDDVRKAELQRNHAEYDAHVLSWQILLDAFESDGGFLDGSYLWPYPREEETAFRERQTMARYHNYLETLVDLYVRQEFTQGVKRTSNDPVYNKWIENVDGHGTPLNDVMKRLASMGLVGGHTAALVDKTGDLPTGPTRADERAKVFVTIFPNVSVSDWRFNKGKLTGVKLLEQPAEPSIAIAPSADMNTLIWDTEGWARFDANGELIDSALTLALDLVPLVVFRPKPSHVSHMIGRPLIGNANILRALYNRASEEDEVLRAQAFSLLTVSVSDSGNVDEARGQIGNTVGTAKAIVVKGTIDYKTPDQSVPQTIRENMQFLVGELYRAAHIRFRRDSLTSESAEAIRLQHIEMNEMLQGLGQSLAQAEREIARCYYAWTEPTPELAQAAFDNADPRAEYPDEFFITELSTDLEAWALALEMDLGLSMSKRIKKRAVRRIEQDIPADELEAIDDEIDAQTEDDIMPAPTDPGGQPDFASIPGPDLQV